MLLAYHKKDREAIVLLLSERRFIVLADPNNTTGFSDGKIYEVPYEKWLAHSLIIFHPNSNVTLGNDIEDLKIHKKYFTVEEI